MVFLAAERATLERLLPGLDAELAAVGTAQLEEKAGPGIEAFRSAGGPALVVPQDLHGLGATPLDAVRVQRAIGSRSPSLAVATTMHHFSVATLMEMTAGGLETILIEGVARQRLLVASGFAEATGRSVLSPGMTGRRTTEGVVLRGAKRPCSLTESMDLLTVSVDLDGRLAVALVPIGVPGVERRTFWSNPALAAAESGEVVLHDVTVPDKLVSYSADHGRLDRAQVGGFLWFELLICASYIGAASALVERALQRDNLPATEAANALAEVETAMAAVERLSSFADGTRRDPDVLAHVVTIRYGIQDLILRAAARATELLGGTAFARNADITLLFAAVRALAFHPPNRGHTAQALVEWIRGGTFRLD
jgi:alkylation response protein AidB-like acyl-CoA dehydrogenase